MNLVRGNKDNITEAVHGLDIFTKNWCMDCKQTEVEKDLIFRCKGCEFEMSGGRCSVKVFANNHKCNYPLKNFGSMGMH